MHQFSASGVHDFRERFEAVLVATSLHDLETFFAQALEGVRVGARLECATTDPRKTQIGDAFRDLEELFFGLHGAGTCIDSDLVCFSTVIGKIGEWLNHG